MRTPAILGGAPAFESAVPVGQLHFPAWGDYERGFRELLARRDRSAGVLVGRLEARLAERLAVRNVICISNATFGLIMAAQALGLTGAVVVPAFTFIASVEALAWANLKPVFCDVDPTTHMITPSLVEAALTPEVSAILAVNLWGAACDQAGLQALADRRGLTLFYDSAQAFGCETGGAPIGAAGAAEVFSFHATKVLSATEGGAITTNDDALAARLRALREGAASAVMSEAQALIGLMSLERAPAILEGNARLYAAYAEGLAGLAGVNLYRPAGVSRTNHQNLVVEIEPAVFGLDRDQLLAALQAENVIARRYFFPGAHRCAPWAESAPVLPNTDRLCERLLQLPLGAFVDEAAVARVCDLLGELQDQAPAIRAGAQIAREP